MTTERMIHGYTRVSCFVISPISLPESESTKVVQDPFSTNHPEPVHQPPTGGGNSRKLYAVLGIVGGLFLVICGGFAALSVMALRSYTNPADVVELETRNNAFKDDETKFREAIQLINQGFDADPCVDGKLCESVANLIAKVQKGEDVPFDIDMFIQAVTATKYLGGEMSMLNRLTLANWLRQYEPVPDTTDEYYRIANVNLVSDRLAEVDLLFYSQYNQPASVRWFLIRKPDDAGDGFDHDSDPWKIYDHAVLEDGRRKSDEYANYLIGAALFSEGFDRAVGDAYEISANWNYSNSEKSIQSLKACEKIPMLADDRDIAFLRMAYIYMEHSEEAEAIRVLGKISYPDRMWGTYPMLALCQANLENYDKAVKAVERAEEQAPGHPRNQWLRAEILRGMNRSDDAADMTSRALVAMPKDNSLYRTLANQHRVKDLPTLIDVASFASSENDFACWLALADAASSDADFAGEVQQQINSLNETDKQKLPKGLSSLIAANIAWAADQMDEAAEHFLTLRDEAADDELKKVAIRDHRYCRLSNEKYAQLLAEVDDVDETLEVMFDWAVSDDYFDDPSLLAKQIQSCDVAKNRPLAIALSGWASMQMGDHDKALELLGQYVDDALEGSEEQDENNQWILKSSKWMIADCLLILGRFDEVISRFPDDIRQHEQAGNWIIQRRDVEMANGFIKCFGNDQRDSVRLQCLKLNAYLATVAGDVTKSDKFHVDAYALGQKIDEAEDTYWSGGLINQRGKDIVLLQALPAEIKSPPAVLFQRIISGAASVEDGNVLQAWFSRAIEDSNVELPDRLRLQAMVGDYHVSQGHWQDALAAFSEPASVGDSSQADIPRTLKRLREGRIMCQLSIGEFDSARTQLSESKDQLGYASIDVPPILLADLAEGKVEKLKTHLAAVDSNDAANWLLQAPRRKLFEQLEGKPAFDQLIDSFPMPIGYHQPQRSVRLLVPRGDSPAKSPSLDTDELSELFSIALGAEAVLHTAEHIEADAAWKLTTEAGDRMLIVVGSASIDAASAGVLQLPGGTNRDSEFNDVNLTSIKVSVLDYEPNANKRLFDIFSELAALVPDALALTDGARVWLASKTSETPFSEAIRWQGRVPVSAKVIETYLSIDESIESNGEEKKESMKASDWKAVLDSTEKPKQVFIHHTCQGIRETLPAELMQVDAENNRVTVRLKSDSAISGYLKSGRVCTTPIANLSPDP